MSEENENLVYESDDFKIEVPFNEQDVEIYILTIINKLNPSQCYIINRKTKTWIEFININNPQDLITFTKKN